MSRITQLQAQIDNLTKLLKSLEGIPSKKIYLHRIYIYINNSLSTQHGHIYFNLFNNSDIGGVYVIPEDTSVIMDTVEELN